MKLIFISILTILSYFIIECAEIQLRLKNNLKDQFFNDKDIHINDVKSFLSGVSVQPEKDTNFIKLNETEPTDLKQNYFDAEVSYSGSSKKSTQPSYNKPAIVKPKSGVIKKAILGYKGRPEEILAEIGKSDLRTGEATSKNRKLAKNTKRRKLDDAGHIIGNVLGGAMVKYNLISQNRNKNRGEYKMEEKKIKDFLEDPKFKRQKISVRTKVNLGYKKKEDMRPSVIKLDVKFYKGQNLFKDPSKKYVHFDKHINNPYYMQMIQNMLNKFQDYTVLN